MKNITHLLDVVDNVRDNVALGLMSDPGLSKTAQVKEWAKKNGRRYCELIISQRMPSEISGMPMPVSDTGRMEIFDFSTLLELEDGDVLAFDEFTNGNIQTLNACLTLIQERTMLSGRKLPSLVIVAMGNPQGKCELLPQTKQRFWWVNVTWDPDTWADYIRRTWDVQPTHMLLEYIGDQYRNGFPSVGSYNYITPRTVENLIRISKTITRDDPFWNVSDVNPNIIDEVYQTVDNNDDFFTLLNRMKEWAIEHEPDPTLLIRLGRCSTMYRLKTFIAELEEEGSYPKFIEYLKTEKEKEKVDDE